MAAPKLSAQDKKDLDKFAKYLVYKCIQIIVQSRLGERVVTHSKPFSSGSDWFNLGITDIPEVKAETVKVFSGVLTMGQKICVEISLKTAEGETMILETWSLTMTEQCDPTARVSYTVYNRMGILLKSLFSMSRCTPAYRLSRKQGPETFVICYRIYMGEPQSSHLGDGYQRAKIGGVPTPIGTYSLSVAYRTKMLISPHTSTKELCEDLQENHFNSEASPKKMNHQRSVNQPRPCPVVYRDRRNSTGDDGLLFGEPQDICTTTFTSSPSDHYLYANGYGTPPPIHRKYSIDGPPNQRQPSLDGGPIHEENKENIPREKPTINNGPKVPAFAPFLALDDVTTGEDDDDVPFCSLLHPQYQHMDPNANPQVDGNSHDSNKLSDTISRSSASTSSAGNPSSQSGHSAGSAPDDFVMVELKTPFAGPEGNSDLGHFYQDCQVAPPLSMFQDTVTIQDTLNSITDQLATFEASSRDFDEFVNSLVVSEG